MINTEKFSQKLREKTIDLFQKKILITNFSGSDQEKDFTEPSNCSGFGRIRHFKLKKNANWITNPLPIEPARAHLNLPQIDSLDAQVFQNASCNWRCWYCYVDFKLLNGDRRYGEFLSCDDLLDLYLREIKRPKMIDLSGGQPDLTPEWIPWMMESLEKKGLADQIYLWSDDNLSNDYLWRYLSDMQIEKLISYPNYSRVCCFKGFDKDSFSMNTNADPNLFDQQFGLFERLFKLGIDLYAYVTLTCSIESDYKYLIPKFIDTLQKIDERLPLRTHPLEITSFSPSRKRMNLQLEESIRVQYKVLEVWKKEIYRRLNVTL